MSDVQAALLDALERRTGRRPAPGDGLASLGVDSVEAAGLIGDLERRFDVRVDADVFDCETIGELARYVEARRGRG